MIEFCLQLLSHNLTWMVISLYLAEAEDQPEGVGGRHLLNHLVCERFVFVYLFYERTLFAGKLLTW